MNGRRASRLAVNPIAYWLVNGKINKSREVFDEAFGHFQTLGYTAVKADVPDGMGTNEYLAWIGSYGLSPSVSLFSSPLEEKVDMVQELDKAKMFAAQQAALGLDRAMASSMMIPARMASPGTGADFRQDRFDLCLNNLGLVCEAFRSEGVRALLHNHVGGVFETESEIDAVMSAIPAGLLGLGPDTGHLVWAGADPAAVIRKHADRMGAVHLKDVLPDFLDVKAREGMSYFAQQSSKRLWTEPGFGVVDFPAILAAMPPEYDGDYMIEVDEPSVDDRFESTKRSYDWAASALSFLG
jgi:inosose dehydratase